MANKDELTARTPVIIGVGQLCDRLGSSDYRRLSVADLAAEAARLAFKDAGVSDVSKIDAIAVIRAIADTIPGEKDILAPFGSPKDYPASIAARLGASPRVGIYSRACGDEPQRLTAEFMRRIEDGEFDIVLICGAEATSTVRGAQSAGEVMDWNEDHHGPYEDRGSGMDHVLTPDLVDHELFGGPPPYALFEHARRARLGLSREDYASRMGELLETFTEVAEQNPLAAVQRRIDGHTLSEVRADNRLIADPYTKSLVARDQINLGAAVIIAASSVADELGIPQAKRVYLAGHAHGTEVSLLTRPEMGSSVAMELTYQAALDAAAIDLRKIDFFDLYSCFPISIFAAADAMGLDPLDERRLTVTGGLPYFGGPGSSYVLHAIASTVDLLRATPGSYGLVGGNGGLLTTHGVGIYTATPVPFREADAAALQASIDAQPRVAALDAPTGEATVETYTITYVRGAPVQAFIFGRTVDDGSRFIATAGHDRATIADMEAHDPIGKRVHVWRNGRFNQFAFGSPS